MSSTIISDEIRATFEDNPGQQLAKIRELRGFTKEYVAGRLHLRVKLIELLEADDYIQMPEAVFVMGYLRAYAKLLNVTPEPFIASFNKYHMLTNEPEKALWQKKRESNKSEMVVRWITGMVTLSAIVAISFWWHTNKAEHAVLAKKEEIVAPAVKAQSEVALTGLSKMQSMFTEKT